MTSSPIEATSPFYPHTQLQEGGNMRRETDWKVYALVVLGSLLIGAGAALAIYSAVGMPVSIQAAFQCTVAVASMGIGILVFPTSREGRTVFTALQEGMSSFTPGQPIGALRPGQNCWVNAFFQLICNVDGYQAALRQLDQRESSARPLLEEYDTYQRERLQGNVSTADTQKIREWLHDSICNAPFERESSTQADAWDFAKHFLQITHQLLPPMVATQGDAPDQFYSAGYFFSLNPHEMRPGESLKNQLNANFFHRGDEPDEESQFLTDPPPHFTIHFANEKTRPLEILEGLELHFSAEEMARETSFRCDGFVVHQGNSYRAGHYVAYIYRAGSWWCVDDAHVQAVSDGFIREAHKQAYIMHYERVV